MSSSPYARTQPGDLTDESLNRNPRYVKAHPNRKGVSITIASCRQCKLCGAQFDPKVSKCPDCGSPSFREYGENELIDIPTRSSTSHLRRRAEYCWNVKTDPVSEDVTRHRLVEVLVPVVNLDTNEWHKESRCKECGAVYGYLEGRAATEDEIGLARQGKIAEPTGSKRLIMGVGGAF